MAEPLPISFAITDLDVGGAERTFVELVKRLERRRWSPSVVCLQAEGPFAAELRAADVPTTAIGLKSSVDLPRVLFTWRRLLAAQQPVLLQTFLYHANILGRLVAKTAGVPIVVSGIRVAERRSQFRLRLDRWTEKWVSQHVCVSQGVRDFSIGAGLSADKCVVISNAVDLERIDEAEAVPRELLTPDSARTVVLYVGRLDPQKGLFDMLEALVQVRDQAPQVWNRLQVALVGDGPQRNALDEFAVQHGLGDHVRFVGWRPDVPCWLAAADGLILPSHWEGMPNVVLEAMAASLPVIATDVEGTQELVQHGETGWLVPPGRPSALANAILEFASNLSQRKQFGRRGREIVAERYTYPEMVRRYQDLYEELVANGGR